MVYYNPDGVKFFMNYIICSNKITEKIERGFMDSGAVPVKLRGMTRFGPFHPLCCHPDMFCFKLANNKWIFYKEAYKTNKKAIDKLNIDIITVNNPESCEYPRDIGLNAAAVGGCVICNAKYTNEEILKRANKIIDVKQGYAKCSTCVVGDNAVITSDVSIYGAALKNNIDALLIESGHINLDGYNYGFIGGCSGLTDKNKLAFTGNIALHPDYEAIKNFCGDRGVEIVSLSDEKLYDYGSIFSV